MTRLSIDALLGGRVFERFVVDLVGDLGATAESDERVQLGGAFAFADLPIVELAVLDLRTHWAEKLSAYLRRYDDRPNTRVKDLVDLVLLIEHGLEPDSRLYRAVTTTFARRQQELPGDRLPSMVETWSEPFAAMAADLSLGSLTAADAHELVEQFWQMAVRHAPPTGPGSPGAAELAERQLELMADSIALFQSGEIGISRVIDDLLVAFNELRTMDEDWRDRFIDAWSELETSYAVALDARAPLPDATDWAVRNAVWELRQLIAEGLAKLDG